MYPCKYKETVCIAPITQARRRRCLRSWQCALLLLLLGSWSVPPLYADEGEMETSNPSWESRRYLIEGVHYLMNEGNHDMAQELFRKAILSSSFSALSRGSDTGETHVPSDRWTVAEAFYFLGKIHYERAAQELATEFHRRNIEEDIAWAKRYLRKAEEYGIVHDRLHPPLLDEINRKYPEVEVPISRPSREEARIMIEIEHGSYQVDAVKVDEHTDVTQSRFLTNKEFALECGARYKVKPDIQGRNRSIYRALTILGIGLAVWFTRG